MTWKNHSTNFMAVDPGNDIFSEVTFSNKNPELIPPSSMTPFSMNCKARKFPTFNWFNSEHFFLFKNESFRRIENGRRRFQGSYKKNRDERRAGQASRKTPLGPKVSGPRSTKKNRMCLLCACIIYMH